MLIFVKVEQEDIRVYLVKTGDQPRRLCRLGLLISDDMIKHLGKLRPLSSIKYGSVFPLYDGDIIFWNDGVISDSVGNQSRQGMYQVDCQIGDSGNIKIEHIDMSDVQVTGSLINLHTSDFYYIWLLEMDGFIDDITIKYFRDNKLNDLLK